MNPSQAEQKRVLKVKEILKELSLDENIVEKLKELNFRSNQHPYHNLQHLFTVAIRAYEGAEYYNLDNDVKKSIVLAALAHDADYTVGECETTNLSAAKKVLQQLCSENLYNQSAKYIDATEFPHNETECLASAIIQDADLMQSFEEDADEFLHGLCVEKNDPNAADPAFPGVNGFNTEWAKEKYILHHSSAA